MCADFFPTICSSLHALTHLRLREYGNVDVAPDFALLQQLTNLRNLHLSPSTFDSTNQLVRSRMHTKTDIQTHSRNSSLSLRSPHWNRSACAIIHL